MIRKIKNWFYDRFLPLWAKETLLADIRKLREENEKILLKLAERDAYIEGLRAGMKSQRRIIINTTEDKK